MGLPQQFGIPAVLVVAGLLARIFHEAQSGVFWRD